MRSSSSLGSILVQIVEIIRISLLIFSFRSTVSVDAIISNPFVSDNLTVICFPSLSVRICVRGPAYGRCRRAQMNWRPYNCSNKTFNCLSMAGPTIVGYC